MEPEDLDGAVVERISIRGIAETVAIGAMWPFLMAMSRAGEWIQRHR